MQCLLENLKSACAVQKPKYVTVRWLPACPGGMGWSLTNALYVFSWKYSYVGCSHTHTCENRGRQLLSGQTRPCFSQVQAGRQKQENTTLYRYMLWEPRPGK